MNTRRLVADVGGTNVRFAIADMDGRLDRVNKFPVTNFPTFPDALSAYRSDAGGLKDINACTVAAAGPVDDDVVKLTNNDWIVDRAQLSTMLDGVPVALVNDLEAVAAALPHLTSEDLTTLGAPAPGRPERRTMLAVNVGTGFGAASAILRDGCWYTCPSEAGHMTLGYTTFGRLDATDAVPANASVESVLSGRGLAQLHERVAGNRHTAHAQRTSSVFAEASRDDDAARTVKLFTAILGRVAGDLALATCAWGGVYFSGSVATAWSAVADISQFRAEFTRKGPMHARMQQVPAAVIRRENAALFGLAMIPLPR
ncbi:MAG: ROK family protein [Rhizobiales bacterium]|nr:ROK family protein [Hyphomicrobiales bacterium]